MKSLRKGLLERSKSEVLRDNVSVVAAEEKCSSIIVLCLLRVLSLTCLCAATHLDPCVRSFVPSSMYSVLHYLLGLAGGREAAAEQIHHRQKFLDAFQC